MDAWRLPFVLHINWPWHDSHDTGAVFAAKVCDLFSSAHQSIRCRGGLAVLCRYIRRPGIAPIIVFAGVGFHQPVMRDELIGPKPPVLAWRDLGRDWIMQCVIFCHRNNQRNES